MGLREIADILCCPICRAPLAYQAEEGRLDCALCGLGFPLDGDILYLLPQKAKELTDHEHGERR